MKYQGKNKLFLSVGTALLIIIALLISFIASPDAQPALFTLSGAIVLMAVLCVAYSYRQYRNIQKRISKLPEDYQALYLNIHELLGTYGISKHDKHSILSMILEIFEHAHLDKRAADDVIGTDIASFVDGFVKEIGYTLTPRYLFGYTTSLFLTFLLFIKGYKVIRAGNITLAALNSETLDVGIVVAYFIISYAFVPWLLFSVRKATRQQWHGVQRLKLLLPMLIPVGLMMALIMIDNTAWRGIIDKPLPIFASPLSLSLGIFMLIAAIILTKFYHRK